MKFASVVFTALLPLLVVFLLMCLIYCLKCRRRNQNRSRSREPTASSNIYTVPTNTYDTVPVYTAPPSNATRQFGHNRIASQGERFAVPLDLLPPNFDFNAPGVQHKGNHVLVKDLSAIEALHRDEYQKQSPYNPNFA